MEHLDNAKKIQKELNDYIGQLKREEYDFITVNTKVLILLFAILVVISFVFSLKVGWLNLDTNSRILLWVIVTVDILGLIWVAARAFLRIKGYRTDIKRLEMLSLRASIKPAGIEEEICEVLKSYYGTASKPKVAEEIETEDKL